MRQSVKDDARALCSPARVLTWRSNVSYIEWAGPRKRSGLWTTASPYLSRVWQVDVQQGCCGRHTSRHALEDMPLFLSRASVCNDPQILLLHQECRDDLQGTRG